MILIINRCKNFLLTFFSNTGLNLSVLSSFFCLFANRLSWSALVPCNQYKKCSTSNIKGCRMGRSDTVSLWYVSLLMNNRFRFF